MLNQELRQALELANNKTEFETIALKNKLSVRSSLKSPVSFAFVQGDFKNKVISKTFCSVCGTSANLLNDTACDDVIHCNHCHGLLNGSIQKESPIKINDPWMDANYIPDYVIQGEIHDDKMATFRNEF